MRAAGAPATPEKSFRMPSTGIALTIRRKFEDLSINGPHGKNFSFTVEKNSRIKLDESAQRSVNPGPGELGFKPIR